jgi:hypothetical protein
MLLSEVAGLRPSEQRCLWTFQCECAGWLGAAFHPLLSMHSLMIKMGRPAHTRREFMREDIAREGVATDFATEDALADIALAALRNC